MARTPVYDGEFFNAGRKHFAHGLGAWRTFVLEDLKATSLADFGCGQGDWLEPLQDDIQVWGCDGYADEAHLRVRPENFSRLALGDIDVAAAVVGKYDAVMSLEAMEHVTADKEANFLDFMLCCEPRVVVFGVASGYGTYDPAQFKLNRLKEKMPGGPDWHVQYGRHHVNCQPTSVVIEKMAARGYVVDEALSAKFSSLRVAGKTKKGRYAFAGFYRKNTRVYVRAA